ncbi:DUF6731 family protein [Pararobbsia silviterrae]|uniref:Uncharacterized protein n=1 Tax=Pararobbsia silviterrae TaxID=1792498 RepID=A0A494YF27_9BURK|nr:DUF6731 family protein [Pararobbsia silviterrae]RKP58973.1 hypothetical protein D7S86_03385 [Pararobbsia silviterrae]
MANDMLVHAFRIHRGDTVPPLEDLLSQITGDPIEQRNRKVGRQDVRLEQIAPPNSVGNPTPYWLLDFTKFRFDHGPSRASLTAASQGFALASDEGFGEETAVLYDPIKHQVLIQYNHHGVRATVIKLYFALYNANSPDTPQILNYDFQIFMNDDANVRLAQKQILTKLNFRIAPIAMSAAQRRAGVSLNRALDLSQELHGHTIEVTVSAGRSQNAMLDTGRVGAIIRKLQQFVADDANTATPVVQAFKVYGKDSVVEPAEEINLLAEKLEERIDGLVLGADLRYTLASRWEGLTRARRGWHNI